MTAAPTPPRSPHQSRVQVGWMEGVEGGWHPWGGLVYAWPMHKVWCMGVHEFLRACGINTSSKGTNTSSESCIQWSGCQSVRHITTQQSLAQYSRVHYIPVKTQYTATHSAHSTVGLRVSYGSWARKHGWNQSVPAGGPAKSAHLLFMWRDSPADLCHAHGCTPRTTCRSCRHSTRITRRN